MAVKTASDGLRARDGGVWTKEKLVYLAKYSAAFMKAMGPKRKLGLWDRLVYIDPLCGPGIDVDRSTGEEFRGSPLIALETAPAFDRIFLGDLSKANVEALEKRVPNGNAARVSLKVEDCHERARQAVQEMTRRDLGLAFVDPEGFEVTFELFRTLAERRIDIVFLFPSGIGIGRNFAKFVQSRHCAMDDLWGARDWRDTAVAKRYAASSARVDLPDDRLDQSWVKAFCERVATLGYTHYDAADALRNEQHVAMYHLLFFSRDEAGVKIWRGIRQINAQGQRSLRF